jgi:serine/threonine protein kinase
MALDLTGTEIGRYRITGRLGAGGMGVVYRAFHPGLQVDVALKMLLPELVSDQLSLTRFHRECTTLARLRHPCLVPVQDSDTHEGAPFYVMPLITDPTLEKDFDSYSSRNEPYPLERAVSVTCDLLSVLTTVHAEGIIHRDIKPANIFVDATGHALLTDFGLARPVADLAITKTGDACGTILWMAPEQLDAANVDARTDLYQVGLILYWMLAGALPFPSELSTIVRVKCSGKALPVPEQQALPPWLPGILAKLTACAPDDRYPDAAAALADFQTADAARPASAPKDQRTERLSGRPRPRTSTTSRVIGPTPARRWPRAPLIALAIALLLLGAVKRLRRRPPQPQPVATVAATVAPLESSVADGWAPGAGARKLAQLYPKSQSTPTDRLFQSFLVSPNLSQLRDFQKAIPPAIFSVVRPPWRFASQNWFGSLSEPPKEGTLPQMIQAFAVVDRCLFEGAKLIRLRRHGKLSHELKRRANALIPDRHDAIQVDLGSQNESDVAKSIGAALDALLFYQSAVYPNFYEQVATQQHPVTLMISTIFVAEYRVLADKARGKETFFTRRMEHGWNALAQRVADMDAAISAFHSPKR